MPTTTSSPWASRACASETPTEAISGVGVDAARRRAVVDLGGVPERVLGRDLTLAEGRVRQLPVGGDVADGVDVRDVRAHVAVDGDPAWLGRHAGGLEADVLDVGDPSRGDEDDVGDDLVLLAGSVLVGQREVAVALLDAGRARAELDRDAAPAEGPLERRDRVGSPRCRSGSAASRRPRPPSRTARRSTRTRRRSRPRRARAGAAARRRARALRSSRCSAGGRCPGSAGWRGASRSRSRRS